MILLLVAKQRYMYTKPSKMQPMQRSFSIVQDDDDLPDTWNDEMKQSQNHDDNNSDITDSEENSNSPKRLIKPAIPLDQKFETLSRTESESKLLAQNLSKILTSGAPALALAAADKNIKKLNHIPTDSDESDNEENRKLPGEYDPKLYENLEVDVEIKEMFQYILKYIPQELNLDHKFKPFIPEYLPAIGDVDAFLKVIPPSTTITGKVFDEESLKLGLIVLDEPAANQSDPALLHLQLRATSVDPRNKNENHGVVKKVDNLEKDAKVIEKWIKDVSDLHKTKSSPIVRYLEPMPDLDDLMQQWPEDIETKLKETGFPKPQSMSLPEYIDTVCNMFQIPVGKKKIQSLHLLFCLYAAIKQTQLYQATAANNGKNNVGRELKQEADQLVLD